ncbi:hypothetical protein IWX90DRAFT_4809 [Phyllosticta citrichinensis]|uniref:Uncharacterized protein n=1 Tax=Phyllosticta citrichinensis TaxID=1130410 RepID=A0ABR1Y5I2_9PEZI
MGSSQVRAFGQGASGPCSRMDTGSTQVILHAMPFTVKSRPDSGACRRRGRRGYTLCINILNCQISGSLYTPLFARHYTTGLATTMPAPEYQNHVLMDGHPEPVFCTFSLTHPRMPQPPDALLQADPLKYLKTFLVLLRPSRMRESEHDYSPINSDLISTDDRKQAIAWISPKLISIMNANAELERQVKNQGPRRTKVLSSDVYQPITQHKMCAEQWSGSDFAFCLTEAMKRLPKEEIKNTRFMVRLGRNPLNGVAARCAADTTSQLGLSMRAWINARCLNGNGSRMNLLCKPIDDVDMRNHALALEAAPQPSRSSSAHASTPQPLPQLQLQPQPKSKPQLQPRPQPKPKSKPRGKKRRSLASTLDSDVDDESDHASDSDYAQPPRKKAATTTATATPPKSKPNPKAKSKSTKAHQQQQQQQKPRAGPRAPGSQAAAVARPVCPSTPAGKQIQVKEEIWSSCVFTLPSLFFCVRVVG